MDYLDFDLEIGQGSGAGYPVVVRSPAGEAGMMMRFPFDKPALESHLKDLRIALIRSGGPPRRSLPPEVQAVRDFGQQLFEALFAGDIRSRYDLSLQLAEQQRIARKSERETGLRVRLHILDPELAVVPWEYLYDARHNQYLCLSRQTPVVRYLNVSQVVQPLRVEPPLRILGMIASPSDMEPLDVQHEKDLMREALKDLQTKGLVEMKWLPGQTWQDLQQAMWGRPWHIFHFIGHGGFNPATNEGVIALANEQGKAHLLTATELGLLLADHKSLRLALLNACEGARGSELDLFSSTAAMLARQAIPAVLAMQYEITDHAAIQCGRTFYNALAAGMPVDSAVAEARKAISLEVTNSLEWGTPVLYLRTPHSVLFDLPPPTLVTQLKPSPAPQEPASPPRRPAYAATLLVLSIAEGPPPLRVNIPPEGMTIGRAQDNDLALPDPTVSKHHIRLSRQGEKWYVSRLPDAQLLYINGHALDQAELRPCDQLVIGGTALRFESSDPRFASINVGSELAPLLITPEPVPHLSVSWPGGRFVALLREGVITLGRAPESGIVIPVGAVSTHHARLHRTSDGSYLIEDQGSRNGLTFQGRRVLQHRFQHGDQLTINSPVGGQFTILAYAVPRR